MTDVQHRDLAAGRWGELSIAEQLGHIGSEISRTVRWKPRNVDVSERALYRALELFDLTLADARLRETPWRIREIARAREVVVDYFAGTNEYGSSDRSLQKYFDAYALAARLSIEPARRP
jgi:hypothetical protein